MYVITEAINPLRARNGVRNNREYVISEYAISVQFSIENRWDHVREYVITESVITKFYCMLPAVLNMRSLYTDEAAEARTFRIIL